METPVRKIEVKSKRARIGRVFDHFLFPISYEDLTEVLATLGFPPASRAPSIGANVVAEPVGVVGRKGEVSVDWNPDRQLIGVSGRTIGPVIVEYRALIEGLQKRMMISELRVKFAETILSFEVSPNESPLGLLSRLERRDMYLDFGKVLGIDVVPYAIHIASPKKTPDNAEWFDLRIEPLIHKWAESYLVSTVYRSHVEPKVIDFAENFSSRLEPLLQILEKYTSKRAT